MDPALVKYNSNSAFLLALHGMRSIEQLSFDENTSDYEIADWQDLG